MILRAGFDKDRQVNDLVDLNSNRCDQIELSSELARIVGSWPLLTDEQRRALSLTAVSFLQARISMW